MCDLKLDLLFDFSGHLAISRIVRKPLSHIKRGELRPFGLNAAPLQLGVGRWAFAKGISITSTSMSMSMSMSMSTGRTVSQTLTLDSGLCPLTSDLCSLPSGLRPPWHAVVPRLPDEGGCPFARSNLSLAIMVIL